MSLPSDKMAPASNERVISFQQAVNEALDISVARDPNVLLMGEGINDPSSFWGTTKGIAERHGSQSVLEIPVAENGMVGVAIGAAMAGLRPVVNFQRVEFALLAIEQIFNNAAKAHYSSNGAHRVPIVIRLVIGRGWGQGPGHSQALETTFAHIPGLKVIMPTFAADAKGMLISAIEDDNPVIVLEHRWLYNLVDNVPVGHYRSPLDGAKVVRSGTDITLVCTAYNTIEALSAAETLSQAGCNAEVIDLRVLNPLNLEKVIESVKKTGRLITVDTGWVTYGVGAEVVAGVIEHAFAYLKVAPTRMGMPNHPTPSSRGLIPGFYPDTVSIVAEVGRSIGMSCEKIEELKLQLQAARGNLPIDVPDPSFKGPF